jgi:HAD superfamily hydrolase (TIGR01549 family)
MTTDASRSPGLRPVRAVLFDFAETLLVPKDTSEMIRAGLSVLGGAHGPEEQIERTAAEIEAAFASADYANTRDRRDLSIADHRAAFTAAFSAAEGILEGLADAMYDRLTDPESWRPYADTKPVLSELSRRGIRAGVVSNIGFDIRPIFSRHGLAESVQAFALSFEHGLVKPDPRLFETAMRALDAEPAETLMVGDNVADAGAVVAGARVYLLPPVVPNAERGLADVLAICSRSSR